jgi:hypothetical protein
VARYLPAALAKGMHESAGEGLCFLSLVVDGFEYLGVDVANI